MGIQQSDYISRGVELVRRRPRKIDWHLGRGAVGKSERRNDMNRGAHRARWVSGVTDQHDTALVPAAELRSIVQSILKG